MNISAIINQNYISVSILEDTRQVSDWLQENDFLAVTDEERCTVGIVTLRDMHREKGYQLIDCAFYKPKVTPQHSLHEVFKMMQENQTEYLPVYQLEDFCGTVSLAAITASLFASVEKLEGRLAGKFLLESAN